MHVGTVKGGFLFNNSSPDEMSMIESAIKGKRDVHTHFGLM